MCQLSVSFVVSTIAAEDTLTTMFYQHDEKVCAWALPQVFHPFVVVPQIPGPGRTTLPPK